MNNKTIFKNSITGLFCIILTSCYTPPASIQLQPINLALTDVKITDKVKTRILISNLYNHQLEYKYTADRGQVISDGSSIAEYYAPFTGGPDTIRVNVYDKTDKKNLPTTSQQVFIQGESLAYVEHPSGATTLAVNESGAIKVASVRGATVKKEIGWGRNPAISPDGRYVAYVSYPGDGSAEIIIKDPTGKETNITNHKSFNINPSWSPIGEDKKQYIVFSSDRDNENKKYHLWKINIDTKQVTQLTKDECDDLQPDWSPDGSKIAFVSNLDEGTEKSYNNLFILDLKTGNRTKITNETMTNKGTYNPSWSPDSQKVVYTRIYQKRQINALSNFQKIWMFDFTRNTSGFGQVVTREFDETIVESYPGFTPDGRSFSFVRNRGAENAFVSLDFSYIRTGVSIGLINEPMQEDELTNITEAKWARQRTYGYSNDSTPTPFPIPSTSNVTPTPSPSPSIDNNSPHPTFLH